MNTNPIFVRSGDDLHEMTEMPYASEDDFQRTLARHPRLLDFGMLADGSPRRLVLIEREIGVPASEAGGAAFSLDHLFVDADAVLTLVEVKRAADTRARREVVAQMLDYAANGSRYWPAQLLRRLFEQTCEAGGKVPAEELAGPLGVQDPDAFWIGVGENLLAGRLRMLFVADQISIELRAIVEFLNRQMTPCEVLAVELRRHTSAGGVEVLVPTVYGDVVVTAKGPGGTGRREWTRADVEAAIAPLGAPGQAVVTTLLDHATNTGARLNSGVGAYPSLIAHYRFAGRYRSTWNLSAHPGGKPALWINLGTLINHLEHDAVVAFAADLATIPPLALKMDDARTKDYNAWPSIAIADLATDPGNATKITQAIDQLVNRST